MDESKSYTQQKNINDSAFTVIAKRKPILILDEDDDEDHEINIKVNASMGTPSSARCHTIDGIRSFQDCSRLQLELMDMQTTLFGGMTKCAVEAQQNYKLLEKEMAQLKTDLQETRTLLRKEKERNEILAAYISSGQGSMMTDLVAWQRLFGKHQTK